MAKRERRPRARRPARKQTQRADPVALELARAAWRAGFGFSSGKGGGRSIDNPGELVTAVAHALAESGDDPHAINTQNSDGSYDYGAWQINSVHTRDGRKRPQSGRFDHRRLVRDVDYNARAALTIQRESGWGAWYAPVSAEHRTRAALAAKQLRLLEANPAGMGGNFATALDERVKDVASNPLSIFEGWADDAIKILLTGALAATGLALFGFGLTKATGASGKVAGAAKTIAGGGAPAAAARAIT